MISLLTSTTDLSPDQRQEAGSKRYLGAILSIVPLDDGTLVLFSATTSGAREIINVAQTYDDLFSNYHLYIAEHLRRVEDERQRRTARDPLLSLDLDDFDLQL